MDEQNSDSAWIYVDGKRSIDSLYEILKNLLHIQNQQNQILCEVKSGIDRVEKFVTSIDVSNEQIRDFVSKAEISVEATKERLCQMEEQLQAMSDSLVEKNVREQNLKIRKQIPCKFISQSSKHT